MAAESSGTIRGCRQAQSSQMSPWAAPGSPCSRAQVGRSTAWAPATWPEVPFPEAPRSFSSNVSAVNQRDAAMLAFGAARQARRRAEEAKASSANRDEPHRRHRRMTLRSSALRMHRLGVAEFGEFLPFEA